MFAELHAGLILIWLGNTGGYHEVITFIWFQPSYTSATASRRYIDFITYETIFCVICNIRYLDRHLQYKLAFSWIRNYKNKLLITSKSFFPRYTYDEKPVCLVFSLLPNFALPCTMDKRKEALGSRHSANFLKWPFITKNFIGPFITGRYKEGIKLGKCRRYHPHHQISLALDLNGMKSCFLYFSLFSRHIWKRDAYSKRANKSSTHG